MVPYWCGCCVSVPRSSPRAERACPYPSPREWYHACMLLWGHGRYFCPVIWVLQHRVGRCFVELLLLSALLWSEGRAGLHVSFPGGLVSWQGHRLVVQVVCQVLWVLQLSLCLLSGLLLLPSTKLRSEDRVGLPVSIPEGMVSCRP